MNCPICNEKLPVENNCCGWSWNLPKRFTPNLKLDFLPKESDRYNNDERFFHLFLPKLSPSLWWAFLFAKNK